MYNEKALEKYNRSLTISEGIGDKLNIALTLAQVGSVKYEQRRYQEAITALSNAISIFEELESPYLELAMKDLDSITEGIGEDEFNEIS
jgi:tetratricopeptide (TPR) repeat protein